MNTPRHMLNVLRLAVALLFASALMSRCASMMTPTGGPRDSLPPVIVNMTPDNFATGRPTVGHGKIYIEFDEFVQLKDQQKEFFTSPAMKKKPLITLRGRGIVVQLRDTLAPNTTYALNFGSAIRDNNEGNPLYSMRYVFSTGPEIDSMVLSGYTADSYKADSVSRASSGSSRPTRSSRSPDTTPRSSSTNPRPSPVPRTTASSSPRTSSRSPTASMPFRIRTTIRCTSRVATRWVSSKGPTTLPRCPISACGTTRSAGT